MSKSNARASTIPPSLLKRPRLFDNDTGDVAKTDVDNEETNKRQRQTDATDDRNISASDTDPSPPNAAVVASDIDLKTAMAKIVAAVAKPKKSSKAIALFIKIVNKHFVIDENGQVAMPSAVNLQLFWRTIDDIVLAVLDPDGRVVCHDAANLLVELKPLIKQFEKCIDAIVDCHVTGVTDAGADTSVAAGEVGVASSDVSAAAADSVSKPSSQNWTIELVKYQLESLTLGCTLHAQCLSDDTFTFCRAMKQITQAIQDGLSVERLEAGEPQDIDPNQILKKQCRNKRIRYSIMAVGTASRSYGKAWARAPINVVFKVLTENRLKLSAPLCAKVDEWNAELIARRAGSARVTSLASLTSHPLRNRKAA